MKKPYYSLFLKCLLGSTLLAPAIALAQETAEEKGELPSWREELAAGLEEARGTVYDDDPGRLARHAAGVAMRRLRGRVPAQTVLEALRERLEAER